MDFDIIKKPKRRNRRRNNDFSSIEKSSSEPDLTDYTPSFPSVWRNLPHECITVDELKFYRRRKSTGRFADSLYHDKDFHTKSNICLYNELEPILPFGDNKTEYESEFGQLELTQRPELRRRSTSLKLDTTALMNDCETEQRSMYRPYLESETSSCRQGMVKNPDNLFLTQHDDQHTVTSGYLEQEDEDKKKPPFDLEIYENQKQHHHQTPANDSQLCHLKLEGELSYLPEYRSKFITFPIEKSHSIPQLSNIKFQGKFIGIPEYADSFKSYENIAKREPIKKPDFFNVSGFVNGVAEYADNFQEPDKTKMEKTVSAKGQDGFQLQGDTKKRLPEYNECFRDPKITAMPERGKPKTSFLGLKGNIDYTPEYRSMYSDFPRSRPITKKPPINFKLCDPNAAATNQQHRHMTQSPSNKKIIPRKNIHSPPPQTISDLENLPFQCQPEVRRAQNDLLIKKRNPASSSSHRPLNLDTIMTHVSGNATDEMTNKSSSTVVSSSIKNKSTSPTFKLTVENVDDPGGTFIKKPTPKFGRRASTTTLGGQHISDAQRIRNRTRVIEGNRNYPDTHNHILGGGGKYNKKTEQNEMSPSFIVLKEPCKPTKWMKSSWYDS